MNILSCCEVIHEGEQMFMVQPFLSFESLDDFFEFWTICEYEFLHKYVVISFFVSQDRLVGIF